MDAERRRREVQQQAVATVGEVVGVRTVQEPVIHEHRVASPHGQRSLAGLVAHRRMVGIERDGSVAVRLGENGVNRDAARV